MTTIDSASLICQSGGKDAYYRIQIVEVEGGYDVPYQNGRNGGAGQQGTKTKAGPVTLEAARKLFENTVKQKMKDSPPYVRVDAQTAAFTQVAADRAARATGLVPQLLNEITMEEAEKLNTDPNHVAELKYDGHRRMLRSTGPGGSAIGSNRSALEVPLHQSVADAVGGLVCELDGEVIDGQFYAFDLLSVGLVDLRGHSHEARKETLDSLEFGPAITVALTARTEAEKRALVAWAWENGQEGVVYKDTRAVYTPDRPNSGGPALKLKNWKFAVVEVLAQNEGKSSVAVGVRDDVSGSGDVVAMGSVTVPPSATLAPGDRFVVKYLYAFEGGSLFEPSIHSRVNVPGHQATLSQIQYKQPHMDVPADLFDCESDVETEAASPMMKMSA